LTASPGTTEGVTIHQEEESAVCAEGGTPVKTLPVLPCPTCGVIDTPVLGPGAGQHVARALCPQGHFIKWLPKAFVQKEAPAMGCINKVFLCGTISKYGVTIRYATTGTPCASFALQLTEQGQDGKVYTLYQDCEVWGKQAEAAAELETGQLCLFEGKLAKRKKGEAWETVISGFSLVPLTLASLTGHSN
jgi:Single-strand binding protein family